MQALIQKELGPLTLAQSDRMWEIDPNPIFSPLNALLLEDADWNPHPPPYCFVMVLSESLDSKRARTVWSKNQDRVTGELRGY